MFGFGKKKKEEATPVREGEELVAPVEGTYKPLAKVSDPIFAQGTLGDGYGVLPSSGVVVAPASGTVALLHDTLHAFVIKSDGGAEILVHIGIDTVELGGRGFEALVAKGDAVEVGQPMVKVDWAAIEPEVPSTEVMVVVTNSKQYLVQKSDESERPVQAGEPVVTVAKL